MGRVIITGATGFVGSHLIRNLKRSDTQWLALVRKRSDELDDLGIGQMLYDDYFQNQSITAEGYIHLAGKAHDLKNTADEEAYFRVNRDLTIKLYDRFLQDEQAEFFTFVSSVKAAADTVSGILTEQTEPNPITAYGRSKREAEVYLTDLRPDGKRVITLRPCMIHGPGNKGNLNLLYNLVQKGIPWPLGAFENSRSFLSADNLCYLFEQILKGEVASGIYNVSDDEPLSTSELVEMIAGVSGKSARIWKLPKGLVRFAAKAGNRLPLPLNEERLAKLTENYVVSNEKVKKKLGIGKMPVSAREGMMHTLKSFQPE